MYLPDEMLVPRTAVRDARASAQLPFGHNRFDRGGIRLLPDPRRTDDARHHRIRLAARQTPPADDAWTSYARAPTACSASTCHSSAPRGPGPHALRRLDGMNTRQAERYRAGSVLLLGDAAHVHSPMGGPGLNLGMQDAVNLGWKLAAVVNGWAPAGLLDTYESERRSGGGAGDDALAGPAGADGAGTRSRRAANAFRRAVEQAGCRDHMADLLAGSDVRYDVGDAHPLSGLAGARPRPRRRPPRRRTAARRPTRAARPVRRRLVRWHAAWADRVDLVTMAVDATAARQC